MANTNPTEKAFDYQLLKILCSIPSLSGNEVAIKNFIIEYVHKHQSRWICTPTIVSGGELQDSFYLVFGKPKTAIFAHMDTVGFMTRYDNELVAVGGPETESGFELEGTDKQGKIEGKLIVKENEKLVIDFERLIEPGTELSFKNNFRETDEYVQTSYLDNRLGVWVALKVAETLKDGIIAFSCWEEHGGGSVPVLIKSVVENYKINQALISDITWVTQGVKHGNGVAISIRDRSIPRRSFVNKIIDLVESSNVSFQKEVEAYGGSDGKELQASPYGIDWCFVGAPESNVHSPNELVYKKDIESMVQAYQILMEKL